MSVCTKLSLRVLYWPCILLKRPCTASFTGSSYTELSGQLSVERLTWKADRAAKVTDWTTASRHPDCHLSRRHMTGRDPCPYPFIARPLCGQSERVVSSAIPLLAWGTINQNNGQRSHTPQARKPGLGDLPTIQRPATVTDQ
ncbi:hypothetical protein ElyMa_000107400 [Elysia marginata]|uniref:Secreted protein n=1 Tax=Elysia marginata TaxID=1093978 RepID=A0AAV4EKG9_9GAST|nr:hypothetical protein ElyMa_000107400 [Elysia marginata]